MKIYLLSAKTSLAFGLWCLAVPLFLSSCGNPLKELADALRESSDKIALAVPGERLLRLIDDCRRGTVQEQKKCREDAKKLFGVDLDAKYQITASFTFDNSTTTGLRADVFPATTQDIRDVQNFVHRGPLRIEPPVGTALLTAMTEAEVKTSVGKAIRKSLTNITYNSSTPGGSFTFVTLGAPLLPQSFYPQQKEENKKRTDDFANHVADAILSVRGGGELVAAKPSIVRPYTQLTGLENVFVLVKKDDFDAATATDQQDFFQVAIIVHEVGHPEKSLNYPDAQPTIFHKADFTRNPTVSGPKGNFVWAVAQVTRYQSITEDSLKQLEKIHGLLERMAKDVKAKSDKK